ncbi:Ppx/GppA phosphatase family protein [Eggerthellaceae bacterium 24-137]
MVLRNGRFAALDIGTVTCRLLVADVEDGAVREVAKEYAITDLGVGVDATGRLSEEAMERVTSTVGRYMAVLASHDASDHPVQGMIAMATSAARDAANADEFARRLAAQGVTLSVIPGEREASLTFAGASSDFPGEGLLVVDIGGGSAELVAGRAGEQPVAAHSFNIGCRRLTERFFHNDPPTADEVSAARAWVREEMTSYFRELTERGFVIDRVVAVAGTATSVVSMRDAMAVYDSARVHKAVVSLDELGALERRMNTQPIEQRRTTVGLDPKRAGVIGAGLVILEEVLRLAGAESYTASESDILKGMILEAAREV